MLSRVGRRICPIFQRLTRTDLPKSIFLVDQYKNNLQLFQKAALNTYTNHSEVSHSHDDDDDEDEDPDDNNVDPLGIFNDDDEDDKNDEMSKQLKEPIIDQFGRSYGTGKRKTSIARVWIKAGSGEFIVNDKEFVDYFQSLQRMHALEVFQVSKTAGHFDVWCTVKGGGMSGQAGAVRLGISRALEAYDPELRPILSRAGMLTRDSRRVERKKPGQKKARKKFQWVKR